MIDRLRNLWETHSGWIGPFETILSLIVILIGFVGWLIFRKRPVLATLANPHEVFPPEPRNLVKMTTDEFISFTRKQRDDAFAERDKAHGAERQQLQDKIDELNRRLAEPEEALAQQHAKILSLEALLAREANQIGGDRINEARTALEKGDYSLADDIFAEIEAKNELAVQEAARAAFGRGEIAEAEVRWADAARHYARAAGLHPTYDALKKASDYSERAGLYQKALQFSGDLVALARQTETPERLASALNEHALNNHKLGNLGDAEALYKEALDIDRATVGTGHPAYAAHVNNLAGVVRAQGRYEEAEALYKQALDIGLMTVGERHPACATRLNNLALVIEVQGRYEEAETLYKQALEIGRATIGEGHPVYAIRLSNLASVVEEQGRYEEAEILYRQALEIDRATIGEGHPNYATRINNLAVLLVKTDRPDEARPLWQQPLAILEKSLPPDHPHIADVKANLATIDRPPKS